MKLCSLILPYQKYRNSLFPFFRNDTFLSLQNNGTIFCLLLILICFVTGITGQSIDFSGTVSLTTSTNCPNPASVFVTSTGTVYAACSGGAVIRINGGVVTSLATQSDCFSPRSVFVTSEGTVYATCSNEVVSINGGIVTPITTSSNCNSPSSVFVTATGTVYATCSGGAVVSINGGTVTSLTTQDNCFTPASVFVTSLGKVYAACSNGAVISIDGGTVTSLTNYINCPYPSSVFVASTGTIYAACNNGGVVGRNGGVVSIAGGAAGTVTSLTTSTNCPNPSRVFVTSTGTVYATCGGRVVSIAGGAAATVTPITTSANCPNPVSVFATSNGAIYAACSGGTVVSIKGGTITSLTTSTYCPSSNSIFVTSTETVYAICDGTVVSINGGTVTPITTSSNCPNARDVFVTSVGTAYVACSEAVVSIAGGAAGAVIPITTSTSCSNPSRVFVTSTETVYAVCGGRVVSIAGGAARTVTSLTTSSNCPYAVSIFVTSTGTVYVACDFGGGVVSINGGIVTPITTSSNCQSPWDIFVTSAGTVYVACSSGVVSIAGGAVGTVTSLTNYTNCPFPSRVFVTPAGTVYAACDGVVVSINGGTVTPITTSTNCPNPRDVFVASSGTVYASCSEGVVAIVSSFNCPQGYYWTAEKCTLCPLGTFHGNTFLSLPSGSICETCYQGSVATTLGSTSCTSCTPGQYFTDPKIPCFDCSPGTYSSTYGSTSCSVCPGGRYGITTGLTNSLCSGECPEGYWCPEGSVSNISLPCTSSNIYCPAGSSKITPIPQGFHTTNCLSQNPKSQCSSATPCTPGTYCEEGIQKICTAGEVSLAQQSQCTQCNAGKYQSHPQQSICNICTVGSYSLSKAATCTPCEQGYYNNADQSASCSQCPRGTYQNTKGSSSCTSCISGKYSTVLNATSSSTCLPCLAGYWCVTGSGISDEICDSSDVYCPVGSSKPLPTPPGTYVSQCKYGDNKINSSTTDQLKGCASYTNCTAGRYCLGGVQKICTRGSASQEKQSKCDFCSPGRYQSLNEQSTCLPCPRGTYQFQHGASFCIDCEPRTFASSEGTNLCSPCSPPSTVNIDRTSCNSPTPCLPGYGTDDITGRCTICRIGTFNNGTGACQIAPPNTYAPKSGASAPLVCPSNVGMICSDGLAHAQEGYWAFTNNNNTGEIQVLPCLKGACLGGTIQRSQCDPTRDQRLNNTLCGRCADDYTQVGGKCVPCKAPDYGALFLTIFLSFLFTGVMHYLARSPSSSSNMSVFFYFTQTGLIICGGNTDAFIDWLNVFNFKPHHSTGSCMLPLNPYQSMAIDMLVPIVYFISLPILMGIHYILDRCLHNWLEPVEPSSSWKHPIQAAMRAFHRSVVGFDINRYIRTLISIYLSSFTGILTLTLEYMYCVKVGNDRVVYHNPAIDCDDSKYKRWLVANVLLFVVGICLIPIGGILYLYKNRDKMNRSKTENKVFLYRYGPLHEVYTEKVFYYQLLVLGRRLLIGIFATVLVTEPKKEYLCFAILHSIFSTIHIHLAPYEEELSNKIEEIGLLLLTLLSCVLLAFPPPFFSKDIAAAIILLYLIPSIILGFDVFRNNIPQFVKDMAPFIWKKKAPVQQVETNPGQASQSVHGRVHRLSSIELQAAPLSSSGDTRRASLAPLINPRRPNSVHPDSPASSVAFTTDEIEAFNLGDQGASSPHPISRPSKHSSWKKPSTASLPEE